jgi:hypothetical protein
MTRNQSLLFFAAAFAFNALMYVFGAPATDINEYGAITVFSEGIAYAVGGVVIPLLIVATWGLIVFIKKKAFPENFIKISAQFSAVLLILFALGDLLS